MKRPTLALVLIAAAAFFVPAAARAQSNVASIEYDRKEEKKIREDPAARVTELLKKVFETR